MNNIYVCVCVCKIKRDIHISVDQLKWAIVRTHHMVDVEKHLTSKNMIPY
jgi:hypothetical protein